MAIPKMQPSLPLPSTEGEPAATVALGMVGGLADANEPLTADDRRSWFGPFLDGANVGDRA